MLPSHLQGLNTYLPPASYGEQAFSDSDLAETLALWTNVEFSFDDGGIGLNSSIKLAEEDERLAREAAAAAQHQQQQHWEAPAASATAAAPEQHQQDPLDPFGFNSTFFAIPTSAAPVAPAPAPQAAAPQPIKQQQQQHLTLENFDFSSLPGYPGAAPAPITASAVPAVAGQKRKLSETSGKASPDETVTGKSPAALSAEEDKRRRNTEASARFRAKKKEREAALEKSARELQARTAALEKEVETLRRENTWLKGLVIAGEGVKTDQSKVTAE